MIQDPETIRINILCNIVRIKYFLCDSLMVSLTTMFTSEGLDWSPAIGQFRKQLASVIAAKGGHVEQHSD